MSLQKTFPYQTDKEQFGREKYFFPDELFFYPFSDCEDRSVLFSRLVRHFTNLQCVGLDFPGHVNTGVCFQEETRGDYVKELISFSIGCILARFSIDKSGLILASQEEIFQDYLKQIPTPSFIPDEDNIIPVLDGEWFTDDIVGRSTNF